MRRLAGWVRRAALPFLAGLVAAAGQAPLSLWPLTLAGLWLLAHLVAGVVSGRTRLGIAWVAGVGYFGGTLFWITEPFMVDAAQDGWMAPFALVGMAGGMALFWAFAGAVADLPATRAGRVAGLGVGLAAGDLMRSYVLTGFPWALIGHVWIPTPVAQAAAMIGPVGLTALTLVAAMAPAVAGTRRGAAAGAGLAALLLGAVWAGGMARLATPYPMPTDPAQVRLVQPNATQALKWQPGMWDLFIDRQMQASAAPAKAPLDLVVWPETSVPYLLDEALPLLAEASAATGGVPLAIGIQRAEGARYFNSLAIIGPGGAVRAVYDKRHLTPFGEYIPYGDLVELVGISAFAARQGNGYTAGAKTMVLDLGHAGRVLPIICYEAVFPQDLRSATRPDWILQITNDGWFGNLAGPWQHLAQARLRAIEQGLPLLRSANTGISAGFDAYGRPLGALELNGDGWLDLAVPAPLPPTLYARTGDLPATIALFAAVLALVARGRRK